jgi:hypothetical protein
MKKIILTIAMAIIAFATASAQVGVNTDSPKTTLDIVQKDTATVKGKGFRLIDGNELAGRVLISDDDGVGTWQQQVVTPVLFGSFANESGKNLYKFVSTWLPSKAYIDLPNGMWRVDMTLLASTALPYERYDTVSAFVRATLSSDTTTTFLSTFSYASSSELGVNSSQHAYRLASGNVFKNKTNSIVQGSIIVRNSSPVTKRYFIICQVQTIQGIPDPLVLLIGEFLGSRWSENSITAMPINLPASM